MVIREVGDGESDAPTEEEEDDAHGHPVVELSGGSPFRRVVIGFDPSGHAGFPGGGFPGAAFPGSLGGFLGGHLGADSQGWAGMSDSEAAAAERESLQAEVERLQEVLDIVTVEVASLEEAPPIVEADDSELADFRERVASLREEQVAAEEEGHQLRARADALERDIEQLPGLMESSHDAFERDIEQTLSGGGVPPVAGSRPHEEEAALVAEELTRRRSEHEGLAAQGEDMERLVEQLRARRAEREGYAQELLARYREVQEQQQGLRAVSRPVVDTLSGQGDDEELEVAELQADLARLNADNTQLKADCHDLKQTARRISEEHDAVHLEADNPEVRAELARAHGELEALRAANARLKAQCTQPATVAVATIEYPPVSHVTRPGHTVMQACVGGLPQPVERRASPLFSTVPLPSKMRAQAPEATVVLSAMPPSYQSPVVRPFVQSTQPASASDLRPQLFLQAAPTVPQQVESRDLLVRTAPPLTYAPQPGTASPPRFSAPLGTYAGNPSLMSASDGSVTYAGNPSTTVPMVHVMSHGHA